MEQIREIPIDDLIASKFNPRKHFPTKDLGELAESIKQKGILEPLLVRETHMGGRFEIIAGERRFRAAELLELKTVPAIVRVMDDEQARETQIIENLQRQDIAPLEEAQAFQDLLKLHNNGEFSENAEGAKQMVLDVKGLAARVGKSKEYVYHRLHLLKLAPAARKALEKGVISAAHAVELAPLHVIQQDTILDEVLLDNSAGEPSSLSVSDLRDEIRARTRPRAEPPEISAKEKARRQRDAAAEKKHQQDFRKQQAKSAAEQELTEQVNRKALALLWDKLKSSKREAANVELIAGAYSQVAGDLGECILIARGKPLPEQRYVQPDWKYLQSLPRTRKLAILALTAMSERCGIYGAKAEKETDAHFRAAGIDRKKIRAQIQAAGKSKVIEVAKAQAASGGILGSTHKMANAPKPVADVGKPKAKARKRRRPTVRTAKRSAGRRKATR